MKRPEMILFDYGHTLVYETGEGALSMAGTALRHAVKNPRSITPEQLADVRDRYFRRMAAILFPAGLELNNRLIDNLIYTELGLTFDLPYEELEYRCCTEAETLTPMEGISELLQALHRAGIRTAVLSNMSHTEAVLQRRISEALPAQHFEFIMASSSYLFRKPSAELFLAAAARAELNPEKIWYCGDDVLLDVEGSFHAGMYPVWYESPLVCVYKEKAGRDPACPHLHIHHWQELSRTLSLPE